MRTMSKVLSDALEGLSADDRRTLIRLAGVGGYSTWLGPLLDGLAVECGRIDVHELATLSALEQDHLAEVERLSEAATWPERPVNP